MACKGCKDKIERARSERQVLDAKLMNAISGAVMRLYQSDNLFARELMALNAELNAQSIKERNELSSPVSSLTLAESVKGQ